jgi:hypothetical protein
MSRIDFRITSILFAALMLITGVSYSASRPAKGWELYSRQVEGEWHFSLIEGTNRLKSCEEITASASMRDIDSLKKMLANVEKGDSTFWIGEQWLAQVQGASGCGLQIPPQDIVKEVVSLYWNLGLKLSIPERNL